MAPSTSAPKRKRPPFSPPRPKATPKASKAKASASKPTSSTNRRGRPPGSSTKSRKATTPSRVSTSASASASVRSPTSSPSLSATSEPDFILAEVSHENVDSVPPISHDLIQRIMHQAFREPEKTTISTAAKAVVGRYVEVFVREAITRCALERQEKEKGNGDGDIGGGDGWLEVEDLEKSAPQLVLDF